MRLKAIRRANPYLNQKIEHKPVQGISPYEATISMLFKAEGNGKVLRVKKECKHCSFDVRLSSNPVTVQINKCPLAAYVCKTCSADICKACCRVCEKCKVNMCFVCSATIFANSGSFFVCPECYELIKYEG